MAQVGLSGTYSSLFFAVILRLRNKHISTNLPFLLIGDPQIQANWRAIPSLKDDPVLESNKRFVCIYKL